jgi:nitrogen fixation/metabolism regulation signal transduction histidine kinase
VATFFVIFITLYAQRIEEGQNQIYMRNQYVVNLLFDNINLRKNLREVAKQNPNMVNSQYLQTLSRGLNLTEEELSNEQRLNEELKKNYDKNREALFAGSKIIALSFIIILLFIFLLMYLLNYWVITPIEKLTQISRNVTRGIYSSRLELKDKKLRDEFDILSATFNQMLDSTETNLEKIKSRERFLQQLIDAVPDAIRVIDKQYNVVMVNSAFNKLFKIKTSAVGKKCYRAYGYNCEGCLQSKYLCPIKEILGGKKETLSTVHEVFKIPLYLSSAKLQFGPK